MNQKLKVGQIVYSLNINNAARHKKQELTPVKIMKIGRKYATCVPVGKEDREYLHAKYCLDGLYQKTNYSPDSKLYITPQDWEDEKEKALICRFIDDNFQYDRSKKNLSLEDLRKIEKILLNNSK